MTDLAPSAQFSPTAAPTASLTNPSVDPPRLGLSPAANLITAKTVSYYHLVRFILAAVCFALGAGLMAWLLHGIG
ncbi:hypothetical protein [Faucicola atlantae]|nr:hypothetical protein [Moraxella atlantae]